MYEAYYGLREKPFSILPDPDLIYWGRAHRMAFSMLEFGVLNSAQFTVITGEVGSGKTTLVRHLLRKVDPRHTNVGLISNTPRSRDELLQWIMMSLDLPFEGSIPSLLKIFQDYLYGQRAHGRRVRVVEYHPEADPPSPLANRAADERQGVVPFRLEDGETLPGCDSDEGFEHTLPLARFVDAIQLQAVPGRGGGAAFTGKSPPMANNPPPPPNHPGTPRPR